jgi:RNA polymerase sigma factor (sigma-70 family)
MSSTEVQGVIEAVWRIEAPKIIAVLTRIVGELELAEDLAQDALVIALERWPKTGIPEKPGPWLLATAKHRAIDRLRRDINLREKYAQIGTELGVQAAASEADFDVSMEENIYDDLLRLIFTACHPVLSTEARVALTLRLLGGLTTAEISRAFLTPEATVAQRIVRAKRTLADAHIPFEIPSKDERTERLASVLEVIYLIFNEGYTASAGEDWVRPALCEEALRLGRILAELSPDEAEVHGLTALMEFQASRIRARVDPLGKPILLNEQNRARWDQLLIRRGLSALDAAHKSGGEPGPYLFQAEIAACHARARTPEETDWVRIAVLYGLLGEIMPSPVVELNRAVAVSMAYGPSAGLEIVDDLSSERALEHYHLLPGVRGDLLARLGRFDEARAEFEHAAALANNQRERELLEARARAAASGHRL